MDHGRGTGNEVYGFRRVCVKGDPRPQDLRIRSPRGDATLTVPRRGSNPFPSKTRRRRSAIGNGTLLRMAARVCGATRKRNACI